MKLLDAKTSKILQAMIKQLVYVNTMKVKKLIEALQDHDPDKTVIVRGYEGGYNEVSKIIEMKVYPHPEQRASYYGEYEKIYQSDSAKNTTAAIQLYGENSKSKD